MGLAMYKMQKSGKVKAKYEAKAEAFEKKLAIQSNMNVTEDMANKNWMNGTWVVQFDKPCHNVKTILNDTSLKDVKKYCFSL